MGTPQNPYITRIAPMHTVGGQHTIAQCITQTAYQNSTRELYRSSPAAFGRYGIISVITSLGTCILARRAQFSTSRAWLDSCRPSYSKKKSSWTVQDRWGMRTGRGNRPFCWHAPPPRQPSTMRGWAMRKRIRSTSRRFGLPRDELAGRAVGRAQLAPALFPDTVLGRFRCGLGASTPSTC